MKAMIRFPALLLTLLFWLVCPLAEAQKKVDPTRKSYRENIAKANEMQKYETALKLCDELIQYETKQKKPGRVVFANYLKMDVYRKSGSPGEAYVLGLEISNKYCLKEEYCRNCNGIYLLLTELALDMSDYRSAINFQDKICKTKYQNQVTFKKAKYYIKMGKPDSAFVVADAYLKYVEQLNDPWQLRQAYNVKGLVAREAEQYHRAIKAFEKAIAIANENGDSEIDHGYLHGNMAQCYKALGKKDLAYQYLLIDADWQLKHKGYSDYAKAVLSLCELDFENKQFATIKTRLNQLLSVPSEKLETEQRIRAHKMFMELANATDNSQLYNVHSENWEHLSKEYLVRETQNYQSLVDALTTSSIKREKQRSEIEKQILSQKLTIQKKEKSRKTLQLWMVIALTSLVFIVIGVFVLRYRSRQKTKQVMHQMKLDAANQRKEILELRVKEQNFTVQMQSAELQMKESLAEELISELKSIDNLEKPDLHRMELFIHNQLEIKTTRAKLDQEMGDVDLELYHTLRAKYPDLQDTDLKLAMMVFMKLSNKDIAIRKNIAPQSAKIAKNRLKKKLGLDSHKDLTKFLHDLVEGGNSEES